MQIVHTVLPAPCTTLLHSFPVFTVLACLDLYPSVLSALPQVVSLAVALEVEHSLHS